MRDFLVKTNFGHTYKWTPERIAEDYAYTALQWQGEEDKPKDYQTLYNTIVDVEEFLSQWFSDYILTDVEYSITSAELIDVDKAEEESFIDRAFILHGRVL